MLKIYHNPRCKKSRAGLQWLRENGHQPEVVEYFKNPLSTDSLNSILNKMHIKAFDLIRTQEVLYKTSFKGLVLNEDEWIKVISENPNLMKRPIVETQLKAVWADPAELSEKVL